MKKTYIKPDIKTVKLNVRQILCTSDPVFGTIWDDSQSGYDIWAD